MTADVREKQLLAQRVDVLSGVHEQRLQLQAQLQQRQQRLLLAEERLLALQQVAVDGFHDAPALAQAERRVAELAADLAPLQLEINEFLAESLDEAENSSETNIEKLPEQAQLTLDLIDLEREILAVQMRRDGWFARQKERVRIQAEATDIIQGRQLQQLLRENQRDNDGVATASVIAGSAGLVTHRRGGIKFDKSCRQQQRYAWRHMSICTCRLTCRRWLPVCGGKITTRP